MIVYKNDGIFLVICLLLASIKLIIHYLQSIRFVWEIREWVPWIELYERRVAYKQYHQSTLVPSRYIADLKGKLLKKRM